MCLQSVKGVPLKDVPEESSSRYKSLGSTAVAPLAAAPVKDVPLLRKSEGDGLAQEQQTVPKQAQDSGATQKDDFPGFDRVQHPVEKHTKEETLPLPPFEAAVSEKTTTIATGALNAVANPSKNRLNTVQNTSEDRLVENSLV